ncbi:hypothetical protein RH915_10325 [Serpentinicella sp. ANB-PHB4]|uniref:hypothetical protein n=1 Tax=Serpentinicella sp. ANB-PHB4 TaxID=3074076 RepID=UPI002855E151|nr:hypothetical protein [Serpentinicella sp. ANB-PHB4]MDR5659884.1 hypothetical protein [Serpentinicella sp. ANB-PHB4]
MFDSLFLNIGLLVVLLYLIKELSKESKLFNKRFILIVGTLLIINIFVTYNYVQTKSSHNTATYNLYQLATNSMEQTRQFTYEDTKRMEDIVVLNQIIEDILNHTQPLLIQMDNTRLLARKQHQQLHTIIDDLSEQLTIFLRHHNSLIAKGEEIDKDQFMHYDQLKTKLFNFAHYFRSGSSSSGVTFGITQHRISLDDNQIERLQKLAEDISNIVTVLTS